MPGTRSTNMPDLFEVSTLIKQRKLSPVELVDSTLKRIDELNPILNAYITILRDEAIATAEAAEREIASGTYRGPLHGVPVSVKDIYWTRGVRTTAGSRVFAQFVPTEDATVVRRLRDAGAIIVAKANTLEFAYASVHPDYGPAKNPWDPAKTASGSSSGSAVAVASGMDFGSFGSDTGGSIRLPAAYCGVVGLKPTYGRISRFGIVPLSYSQDHPGPLARSVRDIALLLSAVAGPDPLDPTAAAVEVPAYVTALSDRLDNITVALVTNFMGPDVDAEVRAAVERAVEVLADGGAIVREIEIPELEGEVALARMHITLAEASHFHREWIETRQGDYTDLVHTRLRAGLELPAVTYIEAKEIREATRRRLREIQHSLDLLVLPTAPTVATPLEGTIPAHEVSRRETELKNLVRRTSPFNLTGQPALSLPCGFSHDGLPIGIQIVGRDFEETKVLCAGHAFQTRTDWHNRWPPCA